MAMERPRPTSKAVVLLNGTTDASLVPTGLVPPIFSFEGMVVFTTSQGTLTVAIECTLDVSTGEFSAMGPVVDATGKLAGATGTISFEGVEDLFTGRFVEDVAGVVCVDLAP